MGGMNISGQIFEYVRKHPNVPVTANEIATELDLTIQQVRAAMRRFAFTPPTDTFFTVVVTANSWIYNPQPDSSSVVSTRTTEVADNARTQVPREADRAASSITYTELDKLANGDVLLRSSDSRLFRATITEL